MAQKAALQANVNFNDRPDLWEVLEQMRKQDLRSRSGFVKRLIEQEASRRAIEIVKNDKQSKRK